MKGFNTGDGYMGLETVSIRSGLSDPAIVD